MDNNVTELGYPAIHTELERFFFGERDDDYSRTQRMLDISNLAKFDLSIPSVEPGRILPKLPADYLANTVETFTNYQTRLRDFITKGFPTKPNKVKLQPGWLRYCDDVVDKVPNPLEDTFIIDIETMVVCGNLPLMCAAVSNQAWYFWLSPVLIGSGGLPEFQNAANLIPVGTNKLIINFFVKFDSKGFEETYELYQHHERNYFFDLMSAHIAVCGMSGKQRELYVLWQQGKANHATGWASQTSTNSLMETWKFHYKPTHVPTIHKELRDIFVTANSLDEIRANLNTLVQYTLTDVEITSQLATALIPKYLSANPHPLTLGGHLLLNSGILPVAPDWYQWVKGVETKWLEVAIELKKELTQIASDIVSDWLAGALDPNQDPWLRHLDWSPATTGKNKGLPAWYRKARAVKKGIPSSITMKSNLAPLLLRICWKGSPVRNFKKYGWCYTPAQDSIDTPEFWVCPDTDEISTKPKEGWVPYDRIPHPGGDSNNCGSPLGKDYIKELDEDGYLSSDNPRAKDFLVRASSITYWQSARERVLEQKPRKFRDKDWLGIDPSLIAHGTSSRRCVEPLWLTTCQPKPTRVGSEILSKVQAPTVDDEDILMGCDFDTQEVKIASLEGEAIGKCSVVGATPMGWMVINGNQKDGTDPHSMVAKPFGVSRQVGKIINFSAIFLCGAAKMASSIKAKNPTWSESYCLELATKALERKRGKKGANGLYSGGTDSESFNFMLTYGNHKPLPGRLNHLQNLADHRPRTPLLKSAMSEAINIKYAPKDFLTTRANWCVQSTGVDLLHTALCVVHYLATQQGIRHRFVLARHDEVWFCVDKSKTLEFAQVLQIASVTCWSLLAKELGFSTLPDNYAWFSGINVDYCIRKEPSTVYSTKTVSNPVELPYGYVLTPSEVWPKQ